MTMMMMMMMMTMMMMTTMTKITVVRIGGNVSDGHESGVKGDDRDDDGECDQVVVTTVVETSDDNERLNVF